MRFDRDFSIISLRSKADLTAFTERVFHAEGTAGRLGVDPDRLRAFIAAVAARYRNNPYHNFQHAVDTVHTMAWLLDLPAFRRHLPDLYRYLLMVVALVHDVDHPGNDNQWEIKTCSPWARQFDNDAVIERHSLDVTLALLADPGLDILAVFDDEQLALARRLLEDLIVCTDFAAHNALLDELGARLRNGPPDYGDPRFLSLICRTLIKAADIGTTTKPFRLARRWGLRVMKEAWAQGEQEKSRDLPVGPLNDPGRAEFNTAQAGFIKNNALELFELLSTVEQGATEMLQALQHNQHCYEAGAKRDGARA